MLQKQNNSCREKAQEFRSEIIFDNEIILGANFRVK